MLERGVFVVGVHVFKCLSLSVCRGVYVVFAIWKKHILAPRGTKSQCHQPHPILAGQQMLDFKVWREAQITELEKCFQNQASNICPIKNALTHLGFH